MYQLNHSNPIIPTGTKARWDVNKAAIELLNQYGDNVPVSEHDKLAAYCGAGPIASLFKNDKPWHQEANDYLSTQLNTEELNRLKCSTLSAYYTSPEIARYIWGILQSLGFKSGNCLSVSAGTGMFTMTQPFANQWTLIEEDKISAKILKNLYPTANVAACGFHTIPLPEDTYDLFIDNVPFGETRLHDPFYPTNYRIHSHAILKGAKAVRPGGLIAVITSTGFLDAPQSQGEREELFRIARPIMAKRLHSQTFKDSSNTEVTSDLMIWQRRDEPMTETIEEFNIARNALSQWWGEANCKKHKVNMGLLAKLREENDANPDKEYVLDVNRQGMLLATTTQQVTRNDETFTVSCNAYIAWARSRSTVGRSSLLGGEFAIAKLYGGGRIAVNPTRPEDQATGFNEIIDFFNQTEKKLYSPSGEKIVSLADFDLYKRMPGEHIEVTDDEGNTSYYEIQTDFRLVEVDAQHHPMLKDFLRLHQGLLDVINAQMSAATEIKIKPLRKTLNVRYDKFVKTYGSLTSRKVIKVLEGNPHFSVVQASVNDDGTKSDIYSKRTTVPGIQLNEFKTALDGLSVCLNQLGAIDIDFIERHSPLSAADIRDEFISKGLAYYCVHSQKWVQASVYCSGDVVTKFEQVQDAINDPDMFRVPEEIRQYLPQIRDAVRGAFPLPCLPPNVPSEVAVECALAVGTDPKDLNGIELEAMLNNAIEVRLGADWIPVDVYEEWIAEYLYPPGISEGALDSEYIQSRELVKVRYTPPPARYFSVNVKSSLKGKKSYLENCTSSYKFEELVMFPLNAKRPRVTWKDSDGKTHLNETETEAARVLVMQLENHFLNWIWQSISRCVRLTKLYNKNLNRYAIATYDGAHLSFPGMSRAIKPRDYQKNAVWRAIQTPSVLLAHEVGLGKTLSMIASIMELRRLKIVNKPVMACMKSTIPQVVKDFRAIYPSANLLVPSTQSYQTTNRRRFLMQLAMGDWDAVILSHEQLYDLKLDDSTIRSYLDDEIAKLEEIMACLSPDDKTLLKITERRKRTLEGRINKIAKDEKKTRRSPLTWEQLGIDCIVLDESQVAKNLGFATAQGDVKGVNSGSDSQIAADINMKCHAVLNAGGKVIFATGTPISNAIGELFTLMRHLIPHILKEIGIDHFDAWCATFCCITEKPEIASTGVYKVVQRLSKFVNMPELMALFHQFADIRTIASANISRPMPLHHTITAEPSDDLINFVENLVARAEKIKSGDVDASTDNMLCITTDGRKGSLNMHLVNLLAKQNPEDKLCKIAITMFRIWRDTAHVRATQVGFCDMSTPVDNDLKAREAEALHNAHKANITDIKDVQRIVDAAKAAKPFTAYHYVKNLLVAMGVPDEEIAFVHDHDSPKKKAHLFAQVNAGIIRIVFGSTRKLGTGVNIQKRLIAMHHFDAPWRPSDIEQREGRGIRYGNNWMLVGCFRYVTTGANGNSGFDSYLFQLLEMKARIYSQIMKEGIGSARTLEDDTETTLSFGEVKAIACGDPLIREKADLEILVTQLSLRFTAHKEREIRLTQKKKELERRVANLPDKIAATHQQLQHLRLFTEEEVSSMEVVEKSPPTNIPGFIQLARLTKKKTVNSLEQLYRLRMSYIENKQHIRENIVHRFEIAQGLTILFNVFPHGTSIFYLVGDGNNKVELEIFCDPAIQLNELNRSVARLMDIPHRLEAELESLDEELRQFPDIPRFEEEEILLGSKKRLAEIDKHLATTQGEAFLATTWPGIKGKASLPPIDSDIIQLLLDQVDDPDPIIEQLLKQVPAVPKPKAAIASQPIPLPPKSTPKVLTAV